MMDTLFTLDHVYEPKEGGEEIKRIGIYTSEEKAKAAMERARARPGFLEYPEGFEINEVKLDTDGWTEGFIRITGDA
ncbi:MAG: hypothetical protein ACLQE9_11835 [Roseiarcus sp.]